MQRNTLIIVVSLVVVVLAAALIFLQVRGQKQAQRPSSPQEVEKQFLAMLGAGAAVTSIVAGMGEFFGYAFRLVVGIVADRTGHYWGLTFLGYAINVLSVPTLALAGQWETAAGLVLIERLGKALRTPARDAMLSHAASQTGQGLAFGIHEALDQKGSGTWGWQPPPPVPTTDGAAVLTGNGTATEPAPLSLPRFSFALTFPLTDTPKFTAQDRDSNRDEKELTASCLRYTYSGQWSLPVSGSESRSKPRHKSRGADGSCIREEAGAGAIFCWLPPAPRGECYAPTTPSALSLRARTHRRSVATDDC